MMSRARKLRYRRRLRMHKLQLQTMGAQTDRYLVRRLDRIVNVRRFVAGWISLVLVLVVVSAAQMYALAGYYQTLQPAPGGMYTEGLIGTFTNANPIYATTSADQTVSKLLFSGLLTYNESNQLTGDLAKSWQADDRGQKYTITLRDDIKWHDGKPLTADDVVFTYSVIQNPDAQSPLNSSWKGVKVEAVNPQTVTFTLQNPLASFPYSLTTGILPKHVLQNVQMADMRSIAFNTNQPVGSGPFRWQDLTITGSTADREEKIMLAANNDYFRGRPKLANFVVHTFPDEDHMLSSYNNHELQAMTGLINQPVDLNADVSVHSFPQSAAMMTFFNMSTGIFSDKNVRQALVQGADTTAARKQLPYAAQAVDAPLLKNQTSYDKTLTQLPYNEAAAAKQLDDDGWLAGKNGIRQKNGQNLEFTLFAESNSETARVSRALQQQWRKLGVNMKIELQDPADFQLTLTQHSYDALLHGISIGADPDVFVYWHSSQADVLAEGRLNFSEYKSAVADGALEQARTRLDPALRAAKYKPFLTAWRDDAPALGLYQPRFLYITRGTVYGLNTYELNSPSDRFYNVQDWMIRRVKTTVD